MRCPGAYPPDLTLGPTDPQMLPPPKLVSAQSQLRASALSALR